MIKRGVMVVADACNHMLVENRKEGLVLTDLGRDGIQLSFTILDAATSSVDRIDEDLMEKFFLKKPKKEKRKNQMRTGLLMPTARSLPADDMGDNVGARSALPAATRMAPANARNGAHRSSGTVDSPSLARHERHSGKTMLTISTMTPTSRLVTVVPWRTAAVAISVVTV